MNIWHLCSLFAAASFLGACSSESESPTTPPTATLEGYKVPGNSTDAKSLGFTDCSDDYKSWKCSNANAKFFGISAPASVSFSIENGKLPDDLDELRYNSIEFALPQLDRDYNCVAEKGSIECFEEGETKNLAKALTATGWKFYEWKSLIKFVHPNHELEITIPLSSNHLYPETSLRFVSQDTVKIHLDRIASEEEQRHSTEAASANFKAAMASSD